MNVGRRFPRPTPRASRAGPRRESAQTPTLPPLLLATDHSDAVDLSTEGVRFHVGSGRRDALRRHPPPRRTLVTYRYHDHTAADLPRFANFLRLHAAL